MVEQKNIFRVNMLGGLSFLYENQPFTIKANNTSKVMQLFLMLLKAGQKGIPRAQILESLYGHEDTYDTKNAFRILVFRLRRLLEETTVPKDNYIYVERGIYHFGGKLIIQIDAAEFEQAARKAMSIADEDKKLNSLIAVCKSYLGEFLPLLANEEWVSVESIYYKELYFKCLTMACDLLTERKQYPEILELCNQAIGIYPFEQWQRVKIDTLMSMNRYKEALKVYEETTTLFFEELGLSPSEDMISRFRVMSERVHYAMGTMTDIKDNLREKEYHSGAYFCNYPSFIDSYRIVSRMLERSGQSVYLILCTMADNKGIPIEKKAILNEQMPNLNLSIKNSLRRGDLYTRYSSNQFLILLIGITKEDCEIAFNRIHAKFKENCPGQKIQIRFFESSIVDIEMKNEKKSFHSIPNVWK